MTSSTFYGYSQTCVISVARVLTSSALSYFTWRKKIVECSIVSVRISYVWLVESKRWFEIYENVSSHIVRFNKLGFSFLDVLHERQALSLEETIDGNGTCVRPSSSEFFEIFFFKVSFPFPERFPWCRNFAFCSTRPYGVFRISGAFNDQVINKHLWEIRRSGLLTARFLIFRTALSLAGTSANQRAGMRSKTGFSIEARILWFLIILRSQARYAFIGSVRAQECWKCCPSVLDHF